MNAIYIVYHDYDVDGGFGDAIYESDIVCAFATEEEAKAYVEKWDNTIIYDKPYDCLTMHSLTYAKLDMSTHTIDTPPYEGWEEETRRAMEDYPELNKVTEEEES